MKKQLASVFTVSCCTLAVLIFLFSPHAFAEPVRAIFCNEQIHLRGNDRVTEIIVVLSGDQTNELRDINKEPNPPLDPHRHNINPFSRVGMANPIGVSLVGGNTQISFSGTNPLGPGGSWHDGFGENGGASGAPGTKIIEDPTFFQKFIILETGERRALPTLNSRLHTTAQSLGPGTGQKVIVFAETTNRDGDKVSFWFAPEGPAGNPFDGFTLDNPGSDPLTLSNVHFGLVDPGRPTDDDFDLGDLSFDGAYDPSKLISLADLIPDGTVLAPGDSMSVPASAIPEPGSIVLLSVGFLALLALIRRHRKQAA
jgi:hypothetical protein